MLPCAHTLIERHKVDQVVLLCILPIHTAVVGFNNADAFHAFLQGQLQAAIVIMGQVAQFLAFELAERDIKVSYIVDVFVLHSVKCYELVNRAGASFMKHLLWRLLNRCASSHTGHRKLVLLLQRDFR